MNRTYRLIWNELRRAWMAAHEGAGAKCAAAVAGIVVAQAVLAGPPAPNTLPTGGQVAAGQATISQADSRMTVNQATDKAILNWQSFSIGANAAVNFVQPGATSVALNRVLGADASAIYGQLKANGQVFLVNPSGVLFAPGARVDVGGLVATSMNIRNEDFLAGNYRFTRDGATGSVINQGELNAAYVALLAPEVRNEGVVAARSVAMAAGDAVKLGITGQRLVDVRVDKATIDTLVENRHLIRADDGMVIMSAQAARELRGRVVNTGLVEANGIVADGGVIRLAASSDIDLGGTLSANAGARGKGGEIVAIADLDNPSSRTTVSGSLSARGGSSGGDGGFVETSASKLKIEDSTRVDTSAPAGRFGQWLLDPTDFTVALSGGDMTGKALSDSLDLGNVTIQTVAAGGGNGDLFVNDAVTWTAKTKLTVKAHRHIEVNAPITASATAVPGVVADSGVILEFGQGSNDGNNLGGTNAEVFVRAPINLVAGATFQTKMGSLGGTETWTVITSEADLAGMPLTDNTVRRALGANITSALATWVPIGDAGNPFLGRFDGLGHTVTGITRANTANTEYVGLFGNIGGDGVVQNVGVVNANLAGLAYVGALAGANDGTIRNSYAKGGTVTGSDIAGVGANVGTNDDAVLAIGGFVGRTAATANISRSYASVNVTATTGDQSAGNGNGGGIGGFVGTHMAGTISDSYATGTVNGTQDVGGFAGFSTSSIVRSYATGAVTGTTNPGGFLGFGMFGGMNLLANTYWNTDTTGQAASAGDGGVGIGNTSTALDNTTGKQEASYAGFDFTSSGQCPSAGCWVIREGVSHPLLRAFLPPLAIKADDQTKVYDGAAFGGAHAARFSSGTNAADARLDGTAVSFGGTWVGATNAGSFTIVPSGPALLSQTDQHGFLSLNFVNGALTITKKALTVNGQTATNRAYDGALAVTLNGGALAGGLIGADVVTLVAGTGAVATAGVGNNKAVTVTGTTLGGAAAGNYSVTDPAGITVNITPKALTVANQTAANKTFDGTTAATLTGGNLVGVVGADVVTLVAGTGTFADAAVGTNKDVTVTGTALGGAGAGNYTVSNPVGLTANITAAAAAVVPAATTPAATTNTTQTNNAADTSKAVANTQPSIQTVSAAVKAPVFENAKGDLTAEQSSNSDPAVSAAANFSVAGMAKPADEGYKHIEASSELVSSIGGIVRPAVPRGAVAGRESATPAGGMVMMQTSDQAAGESEGAGGDGDRQRMRGTAAGAGQAAPRAEVRATATGGSRRDDIGTGRIGGTSPGGGRLGVSTRGTQVGRTGAGGRLGTGTAR